MAGLLAATRALVERAASTDNRSLLAYATDQGVNGLLVHALGPNAGPLLAAERRRLAVEEELNLVEMRRAVDALAGAGVKAAILKGSALAYTHYPERWTRPRADLDLLVARADRERAGAALRAAGYSSGRLMTGRWVAQQELWLRTAAPDAIFGIDLHVELINRVFFWNRPAANAVLTRAVPAPFAGAAAWQLDPADALVFSCLHRVVHHLGDARLIWDEDIARQASALTAGDAASFRERVTAVGVASICGHELQRVADLAGGRLGLFDRRAIDAIERAGAGERAAVFLRPGRGRAADLWLDLTALRRWRDRAGLIREHAFPSRASMMRQAGATAANLPWRYARRLLTAPFRWLAGRPPRGG